MSLSLGQTALSHIAISCASLEKSIHFYTHVLGLEVNESLGRNKENIKINVGAGSYLELFPLEMYQASGQGTLVHFAITVQCLESAMAFLETKEVGVLRGPFDIKGLDGKTIARRIIFIQGPDSEEIELVQNLKPDPLG